MGAFKDELNRMGFIRVDIILRDVGTEGSEGEESPSMCEGEGDVQCK